MKKILSVMGIQLLILAGLVLLLYPAVSGWLAERYHVSEIKNYDGIINSMTVQKMQEERQKAEEYNDALSRNGIIDPFIPSGGICLPENYISILNLDGIIGYIEIPAINVSLPIYHGTDKKTLEKGVGHMEMTAFPIGGKGNHTVLTGHTGLPSSKLFTDLEKVKTGDMFYIRVLDETLVYEVDQILVVSPENTEDLLPVSGEDYVTLITCTPYAVNSHRLLVRGSRITVPPQVTDKIESEANTNIIESNSDWCIWLIAGTAVFLIACRAVYLYLKRRKKRRGR